jgi:hypothetical protein
MLDRDPKGKYIWSGLALEAWLPELLAKARGFNPLVTALRACSEWSRKQEADHYGKAATAQADAVNDPAHRDARTDWAIGRAAKWRKQRSVLENAIKDLEAIG